MITLTIDGPAGSGKGTTAKLLAQKMNFRYLDSGAMYRALGLHLAEHRALSGNYQIEHLLENITPEELTSIVIDFDQYRFVRLNGIIFENFIRTSEVGLYASQIASQKVVRDFIIPTGQKILTTDNYILEGRDTGTVWAPNAQVKFYLVADQKIRAERRFLELQGKKETITFEAVLQQIVDRDKRDMEREDGPLRKPEGAYEIDTTHLTIPEQVTALYDVAQKVLGRLPV